MKYLEPKPDSFFLFSIAKNPKKASLSRKKTNHFALSKKIRHPGAAIRTDCLATTQGGDLNRQPGGSERKTIAPGDTPMVPFVTKRIERFAMSIF